jgi:hypothetical protein
MSSKLIQIMELAEEINSAGIAHVFVVYSGHVQLVNVYARPVDADYRSESEYHARLFDEYAYLDGASGFSKSTDDLIARLEGLKRQEQAA